MKRVDMKFDMNFNVEFSNVEGFGLSKIYFSQEQKSVAKGMTGAVPFYAVINFSTEERWVTTKGEAIVWLLNHGCSPTTLEKLLELNDREED